MNKKYIYHAANSIFQKGQEYDTFSVFRTVSCPKTNKEWKDRFTAINCTDTTGYMCIPDEKLTNLLEFCYVRSEIGLPEGIFTFTCNRIV